MKAAIQGFLAALTILGAATGLLSFSIDKDTTWRAGPVVWAFALVLIVAFTAINVVRHLVVRARTSLPKVRVARPISVDGTERLILLLEPSHLIGIGAGVSVFSQMGEFEVLIGVGEVATVQQNGAIQVNVMIRAEGHQTVWERVRSNDKTALEALLIKPSIPLHLLPRQA